MCQEDSAACGPAGDHGAVSSSKRFTPDLWSNDTNESSRQKFFIEDFFVSNYSIQSSNRFSLNLDMKIQETSILKLFLVMKHGSTTMILRVHAMETQGVTTNAKEISCAEVSWKDHGNSFYWYTEGVLLLEFMPHKTTITGDTYASTMKTLHEAMKEEHRGKLSAGVFLLHDNVSAHNHPPYSRDRTPSDHFLFRNLKKLLCGQRFPNDNAVKEAVTGFLQQQEVSYYSEGIRSLEAMWNKCDEVKGD
ncbi:histone-lysine N-methyltransferase SETMAR-like [Bufo bufo]|uniref:histone-lysine N-methyltransferase SETMAR-like n=1 Tax=Bufo bufo TaxID=8384 RepID=UPI001ABEAB02|nr:histone-lysine N-methyltransferase SETMAR-like [Bufo bufo]